MAEGSARPIIIIKKKVNHGGHHGGAWKVAYADFVTAMMALFIVLWLLSSSKPVQEAVGGYFRDPNGVASKKGSSMIGATESPATSPDDMPKLKDQLEKSISHNADLNKLKDQIEITITSEGLRIELLESEKGTFFGSGSAKPSASGAELLKLLAGELGKLPNKMSIEGHTDSKPFAKNGDYGNWELSSDRANAARRLMQQSGVAANQVLQVRGFADQKLRKPDQALDASNRRITLIVQYIPKEWEDKIQSPRATPDASGPAKTVAGNAPTETKPGEAKAGDKESNAPPARKE